MTTATQNGKHKLHSAYHEANKDALDKVDRMMSGRPLMTLEDDGPNLKSQISNLKSQTKPAASAVPLTDEALLAGQAARELIPVKFLVESPYQPRVGYDQEKITELAAALQAAGINHTDLTVRLVRGGKSKQAGMYQVIAGHRRRLAAMQAGLPALWCKVVDVEDATARRMCRTDNLQREDLSPLERLYAYRDMLKDGDYATQGELAAALGIAAPTLSNQLRVLELPYEWTQLISQEKLSVTHLRCLVPWKDRPAVLAAARQELNENWKRGLSEGEDPRMPTVTEWEDAVADAVKEVSRPILGGKNHFHESHQIQKGKKTEWLDINQDDIPHAAAIEAQRERLEILDVKDLGERAFNVELWGKLSSQAQASRKTKTNGRVEDDSTKSKAGKPKPLTAAEQKHRDKQKSEQLNKRLYRYRCEWLKRAIVERISRASNTELLKHLLCWAAAGGAQFGHQREQEFGHAVIDAGGTQKSSRRGYTKRTNVWTSLATLSEGGEGLSLTTLARSTLTLWYQHTVEGYSTDLPPDFLEDAAADVAIDMAKQWRLEREYLELLDKSQLTEQLKEWSIVLRGKGNEPRLPENMKREEIITGILLHFGEEPKASFPKLLQSLKPVELV